VCERRISLQGRVSEQVVGTFRKRRFWRTRENKRMEWRAATIYEVSGIVEHDLKRCGGEQAATFARYRVDLHVAPLCRYGKDESVVIVACSVSIYLS
jgi:hypothetical protein